jgi:hypothetical protein
MKFSIVFLSLFLICKNLSAFPEKYLHDKNYIGSKASTDLETLQKKNAQRTQFDEPQSQQPTYVLSLNGYLPAGASCEKFYSKLSALLMPPALPTDNSFYDYAALCWGGSDEPYFAVGVHLQAFSAADQKIVENYMSAANGIVISGFELQFHQINKVENSKSIFAQWKDQNGKYKNLGKLGPKPQVSFSLAEYLEKREIERQNIYAKPVAETISYLNNFFGLEDTKEFVKTSLRKANYIQSENRLIFTKTTGGTLQGQWYDGNFKDCTSYANGLCLNSDFRVLEYKSNLDVASISARLKNRNKYQQSYILSKDALIPMTRTCQDIVEKLTNVYTGDNFPADKAIVDYTFMCIPSGEENYIMAQMLIEASNENNTEAVDLYLKQVQSLNLFGIQFDFKKIQSVSYSKKISARFISNWDTMVPDYQFATNPLDFKTKSWAQFYDQKELERLSFIDRNISVTLNFIESVYGKDIKEKFATNYLKKTNYLTSDNIFSITTDTNEVINSQWIWGSVRYCPRFGSDMCIAE